MEGLVPYPTRLRNGRLQSITSAIAAAAMPTHDSLKFPNEREDQVIIDAKETEVDMPKNDVETFSTSDISSENEVPVNVSSTGTAEQNDLTLSQRSDSSVNILQKGTTKIEMGLQSQVLVAPGMWAQLYFEITNTRAESVYHNIQVIDEKRYLQRLSPQR